VLQVETVLNKMMDAL